MTAELADRVGITPAAMLELLEESMAAGVVEPSEHGWRLTPGAREHYGAALGAFCLPSADDLSTPARHADTRDTRDRAA
jgi:hypothetical protein